MFQIDAVYIIVFIVGAIVGAVAAWLYAASHYRTAWLRRALLTKNPEVWDLVHFVLKDEEEDKDKTKQHPRIKPGK